ncbi:DUF6231 family protein [Spiribacter onubensis]|uniref:DUF6231 family protein n=1 Tax=Spiribacter onubensis TaxID=3122420 RepID=A0ABV3S7T0_9GAMM
MNTQAPDTLELLDTAIESAGEDMSLVVTDTSPLRRALADRRVMLFGPDAAASHLDGLPRAALAVVDGASAFPSATGAIQLVGRLRDLHADRVLVIASGEPDGHLGRQELIGLGFQRWGSSRDPDGRRRWYEFDIAHYKVTPDWLNARHWANPELWDKYRW